METTAHAKCNSTKANGCQKYNHVTPVFRELHWLPIVFHAQFEAMIMTFKALKELGPGYLRTRLLHYHP